MLTYPIVKFTKLSKPRAPPKKPVKKIKNETKFARCPRTGGVGRGLVLS